MAERRILIRGGHILTMDDQLGDFETGDLLIEGTRIAKVAEHIDEPADEVIDARGTFVIPGLIDTHIHLWQTTVRGTAVEIIGPEYQANVKRLRLNYTAQDKYVANYVGALEAVSGGTTTAIDHCHDVPSNEHSHATLRGTREAGLRTVYAPTMNSRAEGNPSTHAERLATVLDARDRILADDNNGLLYPGMALTDVPFVKAAGDRWEWLTREAEFARENGIFMTIHTTSQDHMTKLHGLGVLGSDLVPSHCRVFSSHEYDLLQANGMSVNITPVADYRHGLWWHVSEAVRRGLNVSYGIDSVVFGAGNLLSQIRLAGEMQRSSDMWTERMQGRGEIRRPGLPLIDAADILKQATLGGAIALGLADKVGSLTPGKQADIVLIKENEFGLTHASPAAYVVYDTDRQSVDTVIINGEVRKRDGRLVDVDYDRIRAMVNESAARICGTPIEGVRRVWWAPKEARAAWDSVAPAKDLGADHGEAAQERVGAPYAG
ncbi:Cytosine/adenosine deaminase [Sinosporangium album]|uniref:Cytosine/adenosine deaminase n=1 Tax=Sinosporangium album TaxID=504805 RepID=A0A1G8C8W0_9ACTN|nr:amidohydrolase family protein [Sinosporangium album]SDH41854.1 Cytosine/adenosine deaminase [Sinosporangium album]